MIRLLLVRHGETDRNVNKRIQGHADVPLNEQGKQQVAALAKRLANEKITAIYTSDLQRAWATAKAIGMYHDVPIYPEPRLREMDFGAWDGLTNEEIRQFESEKLAAWHHDLSSVTPPGGESLAQMTERVRSLLNDLVNNHAGDTIILTAHGGPLQMFLCLALNLHPRFLWRFRIDNASLSELHIFPKEIIIAQLNSTFHYKYTH